MCLRQQEGLERKRLTKLTEFSNMVVSNVGEDSVDGMVEGGSQNSVGW